MRLWHPIAFSIVISLSCAQGAWSHVDVFCDYSLDQAKQYGAYLGAGREAEAQKIAAECLRLDDTAAMREALNNMAKGMHQARAAQSKAAK